MKLPALGWLPSAGLPVTPRQLLAAANDGDPASGLRAGLAERLGVERVSLRASGRDALRTLVASASSHTGRDEIVVAAYTCFSVPAAAVACGLRVRIVDVTEDGRIDPKALERLPLERAAAVVVCNLFGLAEPIAEIAGLCRAAGALVVDDAAQAFGASGRDGVAGGRGDAGVLSFGRGKPLSGLGGGAIVWSDWPEQIPDPILPEPARVRAVVRATAYNLALRPAFFRMLSSIPALGIGETHFDVDFARGPIDPAALALAAAALPGTLAAAAARRAEAERLAAVLCRGTALRALLAGSERCGVYPRLFALAPDGRRRDAALGALRPLGAGITGMYPTALDQVPALRPHLRGIDNYPGARILAERLMTFPTHGRLRGRRLRDVAAVLAETLCGHDADAERAA